MPKKLSDLTTQETTSFLRMIEKFVQELSEEDENEKSIIASLEHVAAKLQETQIRHGPSMTSGELLTFFESSMFSTDASTSVWAKLKPGPLTFLPDKIPVITSLGLKENANHNRLTIEVTKDLISLIRAHGSFSTEAGCRMLVNAILLHVVSNLSHGDVDVGIVPEFQMRTDPTRFEYAPTSYGDVVDFLIVKGPPASIAFLLDGPKLAFTNPDMAKHLSSNIYQAKKDGFRDAIPQAAMAVASYCRQHELSTFRGCVTNGEIWVYLVFNVDDSGDGGTVGISKEFRLEKDLSGLPIILGLLSDWIINAKEREQQFFTYFET